MTYITQIPKSKPKKFSILCTFKLNQTESKTNREFQSSGNLFFASRKPLPKRAGSGSGSYDGVQRLRNLCKNEAVVWTRSGQDRPLKQNGRYDKFGTCRGASFKWVIWSIIYFFGRMLTFFGRSNTESVRSIYFCCLFTV